MRASNLLIDSQHWNEDLLKEMFTNEDQKLILGIYLADNSVDDGIFGDMLCLESSL